MGGLCGLVRNERWRRGGLAGPSQSQCPGAGASAEGTDAAALGIPGDAACPLWTPGLRLAIWKQWRLGSLVRGLAEEAEDTADKVDIIRAALIAGNLDLEA